MKKSNHINLAGPDALVCNLTESDRLAFEMASRGAVSGTLAEWPALTAAFDRLEITLHPTTSSKTLQFIAQLIMTLYFPNNQEQSKTGATHDILKIIL